MGVTGCVVRKPRPAHSQDTAVGLGPALGSPALAWPAQSPFLCPCHTVETGALTSLLGQSWPGEERRAGLRGSLPSSVTGTYPIYLFWLKKEQKQLCIAFGLTHKLSYPWACVRVISLLPPPRKQPLPALPTCVLPPCHPCKPCLCTDLLNLATPLKTGLLSVLGLECLVGSPGHLLLVSALCPPEARAASWRGGGSAGSLPSLREPHCLEPMTFWPRRGACQGSSTEGELRRRLRCGHGSHPAAGTPGVTPSSRPCLGPLSRGSLWLAEGLSSPAGTGGAPCVCPRTARPP